MDNKVCIYTICKNELQFVDRWLDSMKEADAIVVLDTGSTDGTYEYLLEKQSEYPQLIVRQQIIDPWRFDVARNESMRDIPDDCNILMSTDLDEILNPGWGDELRSRWIEGQHQRGVYFYTWSHLDDGSDGRVFQYDKIHSKDWEWIAPVHEYLYKKGTHWDGSYDGNTVLYLTDTDKVHLHHYPDMNKSRGSYLPLLELREKEMPEDWYGLIYLAQEYIYRGHYQKGIDKFNYILSNYADKYNSVEKASCYLFMGEAYTELDDLDKAIWAYQMAIDIDPTYREPYLNLGKVYYQKKMYDLAIAAIKMGMKNSWRHYTWLERNESWSWEPWDLLCQIHFYNGNKLESIAYAAKALTFEPSNSRLQQNLELCLNLSEDKELI